MEDDVLDIDDVGEWLLVELAKEERRLDEEGQRYHTAAAAYDVARRRYVAVRDATARYIGVFPYDPSVQWPDKAIRLVPRAIHGRWRFAELPMGEALVIVLKEAGEPLTSPQIAVHLLHGGLNVAGSRAIHAATINTPGIVKEGDTYRYERPEADAEDLPLE